METDHYYSLLGEKIAVLRGSMNIKQEELAEVLNISRPSMVNIEKGRQRPSIYMLQLIAEYFNVEIESLLPNMQKRPLTQIYAVGADETMLQSATINRFFKLVTSGK